MSDREKNGFEIVFWPRKSCPTHKLTILSGISLSFPQAFSEGAKMAKKYLNWNLTIHIGGQFHQLLAALRNHSFVIYNFDCFHLILYLPDFTLM